MKVKLLHAPDEPDNTKKSKTHEGPKHQIHERKESDPLDKLLKKTSIRRTQFYSLYSFYHTVSLEPALALLGGFHLAEAELQRGEGGEYRI